jgi:hypothetical protein
MPGTGGNYDGISDRSLASCFDHVSMYELKPETVAMSRKTRRSLLSRCRAFFASRFCFGVML